MSERKEVVAGAAKLEAGASVHRWTIFGHLSSVSDGQEQLNAINGGEAWTHDTQSESSKCQRK
jgi:hypothetical protein